MSKYFHNHCNCNCHKPQYIVLFSGDDSNFVGNQTIFIELETDIDTTGCKAHLKYISKTFTWNAIPEDKRLELVFSAEETKAMPLGDWDAELWLEDAQGRRRTVSNQIRIRVTKSVGDAYGNEAPQSIKASIGNAFDYNNAYNKPSINGHTLSGDLTLADIGVGQSMISDAAGNVIRADGSAVVVDGSWTCNGVVLTKRTDRDDYWENVERHWGLGYNKGSSWLFTDGSGFASTTAPSDSTKLSFVIGGVTYNATIGRADSVVMAGDVVPMGDGTKVIATIGGKEIKIPAGGDSVSSVNGKTGDVNLVAEDIGALALINDVNGNKTAVTIGSRTGGVGPYSLANGNNVAASGQGSHAEGLNAVASGAYSNANGMFTEALGQGSYALGYMTKTLPSHRHAFVWNGYGLISEKYQSRGEGTFNINPFGGVGGFYIGEKNLSEVINDEIVKRLSTIDPDNASVYDLIKALKGE